MHMKRIKINILKSQLVVEVILSNPNYIAVISYKPTTHSPNGFSVNGHDLMHYNEWVFWYIFSI